MRTKLTELEASATLESNEQLDAANKRHSETVSDLQQRIDSLSADLETLKQEKLDFMESLNRLNTDISLLARNLAGKETGNLEHQNLSPELDALKLEILGVAENLASKEPEILSLKEAIEIITNERDQLLTEVGFKLESHLPLESPLYFRIGQLRIKT